jgi:hypothetical protein
VPGFHDGFILKRQHRRLAGAQVFEIVVTPLADGVPKQDGSLPAVTLKMSTPRRSPGNGCTVLNSKVLMEPATPITPKALTRSRCMTKSHCSTLAFTEA